MEVTAFAAIFLIAVPLYLAWRPSWRSAGEITAMFTVIFLLSVAAEPSHRTIDRAIEAAPFVILLALLNFGAVFLRLRFSGRKAAA